MSTDSSIEERLQVIREIFLVIGHNPNIMNSDGPKIDCFHLVAAILEDVPYACTTRPWLFRTLRRSPVWDRVRPYLRYSDASCGRKGCQHHRDFHSGPTKNCTCTNPHWPLTGGCTSIPCQCNEYVPKDFK